MKNAHHNSKRDVFRLLLLSNQQSNTQRLFIYCHKGQRKAADPHVQETGTNKCLTLSLEKCLKRLTDY